MMPLHTPTLTCWPGWPYADNELERLRRLERQADIEAEKQRIRDRLRARGINPDRPGCPPFVVPAPLPRPCPVVRPFRPVTVDDVLGRVPRS